MRRVAIIQARMGSSRLPGKVLMPLAGKPVLWHVIQRLRQCRCLDEIAIATSLAAADDAVAEFAAAEKVTVVRGSEDNVLARYLLAARQLDADIIVRITGDAPLVDPVVIDCLVDTLIERQADYCVGDPAVPVIHEGIDPFTRRALEKLAREAGDDPVAKEHVSAYFKLHPEFVPVAFVSLGPEHRFSGARVSVDTPADLRFMEEVYRRLGAPPGRANVLEVVRLLRREPDLLFINAHVHQKKADEPTRRVLFRCDGDGRLGLGHVVRCLALADELRDSFGCGVSFAMLAGPAGFDLVRQAGYPFLTASVDDGDVWLDRLIAQLRPDTLVLDVRSGLSRTRVDRWRQNGALVCVLDDPGERRLAADLAFYPPVPQVREWDWTDFAGRLYAGWEWVVLRREFAGLHRRVPAGRPMVLVTMGGSDPAGLSLKAVEALDGLERDFDTVLVLGPAFSRGKELEMLLAASCRRWEVQANVRDISGLMTRADLAVASFGVTAYELAAMGVPAVYLCLSADHALSASIFVEAGAAVSLGLHQEVTPQALAKEVDSLLAAPERLARMSEAAGTLLDGRGAARVARRIVEEMRERHG